MWEIPASFYDLTKGLLSSLTYCLTMHVKAKNAKTRVSFCSFKTTRLRPSLFSSVLLNSPTSCDANPATSFPPHFLKHRNSSQFPSPWAEEMLAGVAARKVTAVLADTPWTAGFLRRNMTSLTAPCVLSVQRSQCTHLRIMCFVCHSHMRVLQLCSSSASLCFVPHSTLRFFFIQHLVTTSSCFVVVCVCVCASFEFLPMAFQTQRRFKRPLTQ